MDKGRKIKQRNRKMLKVLGNILFLMFISLLSVLIFITFQSRIIGKEPSMLGYRLYIVDSGSMNPAIGVDSMIVVKELVSSEINKGDIATYYGSNTGTRITHRIADVLGEEDLFITKGDANNVEDPTPLKGEKIIGKVVLTIPLIGKLFRFLGTAAGVVLVISLGTLWLIVPKLLEKKMGLRTEEQTFVETEDSQKVD